jgi:hypothetical protein
MTPKLLRAVVVLAAVSLCAAVAATAAFYASTSSGADSFAAGTVALSDNDNGAAMLALSSATSGDSDTSCIQVRFDGTLDSSVRLYGTTSGTLAQYLTLTVTRGTDSSPSFDSCPSFTADSTNYVGSGAGVIYSGALSGFPSTYAAGLVDPTSGSPETWSASETHSYRFVVTVGSNTAGQGQTASAAFTWEARNL